jgi:monoamine oxidase
MKDVVIIGAGAAGLAAAAEVERAGRSYQLIEAQPWIGGRARTDRARFGVPVDLGCHWLHSPAQNPFAAAAERFGYRVRKGAQSEAYAWNGERLDAERFVDASAYVEACFDRIIAAKAEPDCAVSALFPEPGPWHAMFEEAFLLKQGLPARVASAHDFGAYVWEGDDWPVEDGLGDLVARTAGDIRAELSTPARRIDWRRSDRVAVQTDRGTIEAHHAIVTVSMGVLQSNLIAFDPALPDWAHSAINALTMGNMNKIVVGFSRNVFGDLEHSLWMSCAADRQAVECVIRPGGENIVVGMVGGPFGKELARAGGAAMADYLVSALSDIFGNDVRAALEPQQLLVDWDANPYTAGCYAVAKPGHADARAALNVPVGDRLHFAGEALHVRYCGDVHGAHFSGIDAARRALQALEPRTAK